MLHRHVCCGFCSCAVQPTGCCPQSSWELHSKGPDVFEVLFPTERNASGHSRTISETPRTGDVPEGVSVCVCEREDCGALPYCPCAPSHRDQVGGTRNLVCISAEWQGLAA